MTRGKRPSRYSAKGLTLPKCVRTETITGDITGDLNALEGRPLEHHRVTDGSERYRLCLGPYKAHGCDYQGKNTADGRCPKCKRKARPQRRGGTL